jgi:N6-adenosine-specific RNA methylase IME4
MTMEDIYNLPVQTISADDCILFLWVTNPMLQEGLETIKRWGFSYKTVAFNWFKKNKIADSWFWGLGYWSRCLGGDTIIKLLDIEKDEIFEEKLENLNKYSFDKIKIWSPDGWKKIYDFIKNENTVVSKISTNIGDVYSSNNHKWIYKKVINRRIGNKKEFSTRKIEHIIVEGTLDDLYKDYNGCYVKKNKYSVNMLYSETPIEIINPISKIDGVELNKELGYMIGLYCAEGSFDTGENKNGKQIRFSLNKKEKEKYERIKKYIKSLNLKNERYYNTDVNVSFHETKNTEAMAVYFSSGKIKKIIKKFISGENAHVKRLNIDLLMKTNIDFRKSFVQGVLEGDGHKNQNEYWRLFLCNKELIEDFIKILDSIGILSKYEEQKPQYTGETLCHKYGLRFYNRNRSHNFKFNEANVRTIEIKNIEKDICEMPTYDISVEGGIFIANNMITHNSNTELCLLATKGKPSRISRGIHQVVDFEQFDTEPIATKIREHSRKPDEVRNRIVELCGNVPRVELFAREKFDGWDVFGNEVKDSIDLR